VNKAVPSANGVSVVGEASHPIPEGKPVAIRGVAGEPRAAIRADPYLLGVSAAALIVVNVDYEAERPVAAHLRPEGVRAFGARGQHQDTA
jgi:hypothetical protein